MIYEPLDAIINHRMYVVLAIKSYLDGITAYHTKFYKFNPRSWWIVYWQYIQILEDFDCLRWMELNHEYVMSTRQGMYTS